MAQNGPERSIRDGDPPAIVGDVVFGNMESPVAVCTLGSRALLPELAGRSEIAVAGRVFTENVGVERMIQNLAAFESVRFLIVCGRETSHRVGDTILALHRHGLDANRRVVGSQAPEPVMPDLSAEQLAAFRTRISVVDMIGVVDAIEIIRKAAELPTTPVATVVRGSAPDDLSEDVAVVVATRDPASSWEYDPIGYFLVFVDRGRGLLRVEQRSQQHVLQTVFEGRRAEALCHTILRHGAVTLLAHAMYLGRELANAESALEHGLAYEQDRALARASEFDHIDLNQGEGGA